MRFYKNILPHIVALLTFAAVSTALFHPEISGQALRQSDVVNHEGMAREIEEYIALNDEHPNWIGTAFGGMPTHTLALDHGVHLFSLANLHHAGSSILMLFVAMAGFYLMLLLMGVKPYFAIVGALAYGLSTYFPIIISAGHITKMWALQWVAPLIGSIWYTYRGKMWLGGALTALFTALLIGSSHHQITYYFLVVILSLAIGQFVVSYRAKLLKHFAQASAILLLAATLGIGSNIAGLYYTADYSTVSTRGGATELIEEGATADPNKTSGLDRDYITAWSYGKGETFNLFIPNFVGGGREFKEGGEVDKVLANYETPRGFYKNISSYYGSQPFTVGPVYIGAVIIFLAILALLLLPGAITWWIIAPTLLALMLSWGHNLAWFTDLFIDYVPLYNKFRVPSMILVIVQWAIPLLGAMGLYQFYNLKSAIPSSYTPKITPEKALMYSVAIAGGFALFSALILPSVVNFAGASDDKMGLPQEIIGAMQSERADLMRADALRTLIYVLLTASILWLYIKGKVKNIIVVIGVVAILVVADLFSVDRRYINPDEFVARSEAKAIVATPMDRAIGEDKSDFRVADFSVGSPFESSRASYFHRSVGGYHAAKMRRYQDVITTHLSQMNYKVYDMLNTKYFITTEGVQPNAAAIGSAILIDSVIWAQNPTQELMLLGAEEFDPARVAIVDEKWRAEVEKATLNSAFDSTDFVRLDRYTPNNITYSVKTAKPRLVLFSEIYHKDWHVTINGQDANSIALDYILRAVVVPSGENIVEWKFIMPHRTTIMSIAAISTTTIILWLGAMAILGIVRLMRSSRRDEQ